MGLELFAPIAWLSLLLLLLLSKCFLPKLFGALAEAMMPQEAVEVCIYTRVPIFVSKEAGQHQSTDQCKLSSSIILTHTHVYT